MRHRFSEIFKPVTDLTKFRTVMATAPHAGVSNKYGFIPTTRPLDVLAQFGWFPVSVAEQRVRVADKEGFQRHAIKLRNTTEERALAVGETFPELMLINEHSGKAAFRLLLALFEKVCSNGLIVERETLKENSVRHVGYTDDAVATAITSIVPHVPQVLQSVDIFRSTKLEPEERQAFAAAAIELRWDPASEKYVNPQSMLYAARREQRDGTLWNTYNVIQEHIVRGGVNVHTPASETQRAKTTHAKAITSLQENERLNRALWKLTERMAELKKAA
jgi:hypothetical protein